MITRRDWKRLAFFAEEFVEREDQKILFVPAFEQLMGYVKKLYPTQRINYQDSSESSKVCMTFFIFKRFSGSVGESFK